MHFLLTNDDGILAPGLAALERAILRIPGALCTVVAPSTEQSQCGHRVTTREPILVHEDGPTRYRVEGTPADCVRLALFALGLKPDFVISGVNAGGNMGQDLPISGTVAAAREAAFHGCRAAALSHYLVKGLAVDWDRVTSWTAELLNELLGQPLADGEFWNINFPHLPAGSAPLPTRVPCHPCRAPLNVSYQTERRDGSVTLHEYTASYAARPTEPGSDVAACFAGIVAVSRVHV